MDKNKWWLNGGRESGRAIRLLCETYENKIADLQQENAKLKEKLEGAEERIVELESTNKQISTECHKLVNSLEKLQKYEKENEQLKAQIEKMKCCANCALEYPKTDGNSEVCRRCRRYLKPFTEWRLDIRNKLDKQVEK